ncbi:MAG: hypothetical protein LN417_03160 [Candidatus Thermoplasmatota archaeon]|nr:hypothetical protein [Candidatus Thermoplasmatota archaeon]
MTKRNEAQNSPKRRRRPGRPSILEVRKDPDLARRAAEMRFLGSSWGEIGSSLGLARSTARRLALMYQKEIGCQSKATKNPAVPNTVDIGTRKGHSQHLDSNIDKDVLEQMPKTFQIFSSLLSRVRDMEGEIE